MLTKALKDAMNTSNDRLCSCTDPHPRHKLTHDASLGYCPGVKDPDSFHEEVEADAIAEERIAIEALRVLYGIKEGRKAFEAEEKKARVPIDNWFKAHPDERELRDPELGYVAKLQSGGTGMAYEKARFIHASALQLFERMLSLDCFEVDHDKVKEAIKDGQLLPSDVEHFRHEVGRTPRLLVEKSKE